jgi:alkylation response protein AidB-like acyl-CoA dehydrogenase
MALVLSEEQELLRETAREFLQEKAPVSQLRGLRDSVDADGFSREVWSELAELGWAGIPFPEEYGGADLGQTELGIVFEECGRNLVATPLFSSVVLSGSAVLLGGTEPQRKEVLTAIASGERIVALALQEGPRHAPYAIDTRATAAGEGYRLDGSKAFVLDGHVADQFIVVARTSGEVGDRSGLTLFLVDAGASGLSVSRTIMVDGRNAARVELVGVEVGRDAILGVVDDGAALLDPVLDRGAAVLAAEMLGMIEVAFEKTLDYLKQRQQFGVPIGSFQALKHRAARMFVARENARSVVLDALHAIDADAERASQKASLAKAQLSEAAFLVCNEGVQMHGGIGVTDEEDIGLYLKRARAAQFSLGDASFHRARWASLRGY